MSNVQISINTTTGQLKLQRLLQAIEPRTVLSVIGARLMSFVDESFQTRGRGQWRPLAQSTLLLRLRGGNAPLQDTGLYKQSFISETDGKTFVEVGSSIKTRDGASLAKIHEFGTGPYTIRVRRARVLAAQTRFGNWLIFGKEVNHPGVPARPVLPAKAVAERLIQDTIDAMLARIQHPEGGRFDGGN